MSAEDVDMLMAITGLGSRDEAKNLLEAFGGDLNSAAEALTSGQGPPAAAPAPAVPSRAPSSVFSPPAAVPTLPHFVAREKERDVAQFLG